MPRITKRLIEAIEPENKDVIIRDSELKGFMCKITPKGKKVYMLYYRLQNGTERRPSIGIHGAVTCDQARDIALNWLSEIAKGNDPSFDKKEIRNTRTSNFAALAERYINEYASIHKKEISIKNDKLFLNNYLISYFDKIPIETLTSQHIEAFHYKMKHKATTSNRCISLLSKMLNLAEKWGIKKDIGSLCRHIDKYPENKREIFLSMTEIERLSAVLKELMLNKTESSSSIAAIRLLLLTGCRLSEILTLKWEYIDIEHHRINFPDSKTGKKTIYISPFVLEVLENLEKMKNNPYVIYGAKEGAHLVNLQKAWKRISKLADLEGVRIHDLRHSFASIGAASGLSLPIIGALLGHSQAQTTARYAHLVGDSLKDAANLIGEKIKSMVG